MSVPRISRTRKARRLLKVRRPVRARVLWSGARWVGSLAIPGIGPFIAAGPIMAALAGAGVGGAVGGLTGALVGMGIPQYEAKRYEGRVKDGGILLSVHSDSSAETK